MQGTWRGQYSKYKDFFLTAYQSYKQKEEVKMFLEIILSLFTASLFIIFALKPTAITILDLLRTIKEKEAVVAQMDTKIKNTQQAQILYNQELARIQLALNSVPNLPTPDTFSTQIQGLSQQSGVDLTNLTVDQIILLGESDNSAPPNTEDLPDGAPGMPFTITVSAGDYNLLLGFLSNLKTLRRAVKVDDVKFSSSITQNGNFLTLVVTGREAYLSQNK